MLYKNVFTVVGNISRDQLEECLKTHIEHKTVAISESTDVDSGEARSEELRRRLEERERRIGYLETLGARAAQSTQNFQRQQQALFGEFVVLRRKYDDLKSTLIEVLWEHCVPFHPDLSHIPPVDPEEEDCVGDNPDQYGKYIAEDYIGEGQFASVRTCREKCVDNTNSEDGANPPVDSTPFAQLAIKLIKKEKIVSMQSLRRLSSEIDSLKSLNSKYVTKYHDILQTRLCLCLITEKGHADLFEFFNQHNTGISENWTREIIVNILKGIHHCHQHGICHRGNLICII
jgi:hypothetical protein